MVFSKTSCSFPAERLFNTREIKTIVVAVVAVVVAEDIGVDDQLFRRSRAKVVNIIGRDGVMVNIAHVGQIMNDLSDKSEVWKVR